MSIKGIHLNRCVWSNDLCLVHFKVPRMVSVPVFSQVSLLSVTYKTHKTLHSTITLGKTLTLFVCLLNL